MTAMQIGTIINVEDSEPIRAALSTSAETRRSVIAMTRFPDSLDIHQVRGLRRYGA
jgi:hypothetical protein